MEKIESWTAWILLLLFILSVVITSIIPKNNTFFDGDFRYFPIPKDEDVGKRTVFLVRVEGKTTGMEEFDIPSTASYKGNAYRITYIFPKAFNSCSNLTGITIPEGITRVEYGAFSYCSNLTNIRVAQGNKNYTSVDGVLFTIDMSSIVAYPAGKKEETYTIPNTVTNIGGGAFHSCFSLTNITIPNTVTNIGERAFARCKSLTRIVIPQGVTTIERETFLNCSSLTNIAIPDTVTDIDGGAFSGCNMLTEVVIPQGVTTIGWETFYGCCSLTNITIPDAVTYIDGGAFAGCKSLTKSVIPESVTTIGREAFYGCSNLTDITIPEGVNRIEERAFRDCNSLKNVYFKGPPADSFIRAFGRKTVLHYIEGTPGWTTPEWNGFTTRIWVPES